MAGNACSLLLLHETCMGEMSATGNHKTIVFCSETKDIVRAWHMTQVVDFR